MHYHCIPELIRLFVHRKSNIIKEQPRDKRAGRRRESQDQTISSIGAAALLALKELQESREDKSLIKDRIIKKEREEAKRIFKDTHPLEAPQKTANSKGAGDEIGLDLSQHSTDTMSPTVSRMVIPGPESPSEGSYPPDDLKQTKGDPVRSAQDILELDVADMKDRRVDTEVSNPPIPPVSPAKIQSQQEVRMVSHDKGEDVINLLNARAATEPIRDKTAEIRSARTATLGRETQSSGGKPVHTEDEEHKAVLAEEKETSVVDRQPKVRPKGPNGESTLEIPETPSKADLPFTETTPPLSLISTVSTQLQPVEIVKADELQHGDLNKDKAILTVDDKAQMQTIQDEPHAGAQVPKSKLSEHNPPATQLSEVSYEILLARPLASILLDAWKRSMEYIAGGSLSWYPMSQPETTLKHGHTRVYSELKVSIIIPHLL